MSQENVEVVRRALDARNRGDIDAALENLHPDVELDWSQSRGAAGGMVQAVIQGRDHVRERLGEFLEMWEEVTWEVEEILEAGPDQVIAVDRLRVSGRDGIELNVTAAALLWTLSGGQVVRVKYFPSKEAALDAAGLSE
jgi:ketosteroid isomerase-like protein